jgi:TnpA family transposase
LQHVSKIVNELDGVTIENGEIHVKKLEKDTPDEAKAYSRLIYSMLPRINLTDLLIEVSNWTHFDDQFIHTSTGKKPREDEKPIIMAALMGMGLNVGLLKMSEATPGITYYQMANTVEWRMYEDSFNKAQATLVNFHHSLNIPIYWGEGKTSSSDGMRVQIGVNALNSVHNPHYGSGKGATMYRWVSDQYSSFYAQVVNTNTRDAIHFVDGLLHHETDLEIEEHYTDTAGYSDQVFGLCHLFGFRFAPRLRDLSNLDLFSFSPPSNFPKIEKLLKSKINTKLIQDNFDDVLRLAHSIREGKVSGSLIMSKLGSYARQNKLAAALKEMGKIEKTIFILDYISNEALRRRIQKGLNKGEATNALARAIFFGKRGELHEKALKDQLQRASALNIIINAISVWNTVYLEKAINYLKEKNVLREDLLSYISPLDWEHINFLGEYTFNMKYIATPGKLRPLNEPINLVFA